MRTQPDESVHAPHERLCLEKGNGARGETLAGGKLSPRSPRLSVHQDSRLEAPSVVAGLTEEDRKALLGHKNGSITSHYSGAEFGKLIEAANMVSTTDSRGPVLTILKRMIG